MISRFVANSEKCRKYTFLGGSAQIITIIHILNLYYVIYGRPLKDIHFVFFQRNICFNFLFALFDIFENNGGAWMDIQCTM